MVYVVMNNGCYGLTKGQDSATADQGSKNKSGSINPFQAIDLASMAIELGASFVAQSFSGDKQQLIPLLKAAIKHPGFAFVAVLLQTQTKAMHKMMRELMSDVLFALKSNGCQINAAAKKCSAQQSHRFAAVTPR